MAERMFMHGAPTHDRVFSLVSPACPAAPFLLNSPHSGEDFPACFLERSQLTRDHLRRASDLYVDRLLWPMASRDVPILAARFPRSFLDVNREPLELDPRLIDGVIPAEANIRSLRVSGGLGTVPRVIGEQVEIYAGKLSLDEVLARIEGYYLPYHIQLNAALLRLHALFGRVYLLDCHSMPSRLAPRGSGNTLPDIVLGDRFGTACAPFLIDAVEREFTAHGLLVARNRPYAGGYITEHYGRPREGWHALQIEINRALYMDEATMTLHSGFFQLSRVLHAVLDRVFVQEVYENHNTGLHFIQSAAE
jgi:N-formylglutamate amidohydrolase